MYKLRLEAAVGLGVLLVVGCGRFSFSLREDSDDDDDDATHDAAVDAVVVDALPDAAATDCGDTSATLRTSCADVLAACPTTQSGARYVFACGDARQVYCDMTSEGGGWTVVDANRDAGWQTCFTEWSAALPAAGATDSCMSWRQWFQPSTPTTQFRKSPTCGDITIATSDEVYRWTGNYYGCNWFNRNCDFSGSTCNMCMDNNSSLRLGTCPYLPALPSPGMGTGADYVYCYDCGTDWWNSAPSIGIAGTDCVAYR